jgi:hypothetical protein
MADDPNPALRTELVTALGDLAPQIRGLHALAAIFEASGSTGALTAVNAQIAAKEHRRDLIQEVLNTLDAVVAARVTLEADGYPTPVVAQVPSSLISEFQEEVADLQAAVAVFQQSAVSVGLDVAHATFSPQTPSTGD